MKIAQVLLALLRFSHFERNQKIVAAYTSMLLEEEDYTEVSIDTEDVATMLFWFANEERKVQTVSQVSAGRKNRMYFEINGSKQSAAWEPELPNQL